MWLLQANAMIDFKNDEIIMFNNTINISLYKFWTLWNMIEQ